MNTVTLALLAGFAHAGLSDPACPTLTGVDTIAEDRGLAHVVVGEAHGTRELPEAFGDLVCNLARDGRPLTVGLEFLPSEQAALDAYLGSDGGAEAASRLLESPGWGDRHGRASEAIFQLVERLRLMRRAGSDLAVTAFDHPTETSAGTSALREETMARLLLEARAQRPEALVVALTGVGHAGRGPWTSFDPPFPSMTQHLATETTLTVNFARAGGEAWACRTLPDTAQERCGGWPMTAREPVSARSIWRDATRPGFDAVLSAGSAYSASAPARDAARTR